MICSAIAICRGSREAVPSWAWRCCDQRFRRLAALVDRRKVFVAAAAAEIAAPVWRPVAPLVTVASIAVTVERGGIDIERGVSCGLALADQLIDGRAFQCGAAGFDRLSLSGRLLQRRGLAEIEQGIGFQRLADERFDLEVGQRQQLDRLLELRRHHQRLGLAQVQAGAEGHCAASSVPRPSTGSG